MSCIKYRMLCEIELRCLQYEHECNQKMHFIYKKYLLIVTGYWQESNTNTKNSNCWISKKRKVESSTFLTKMFFVFPTFQPSLSTLPMSIIHTPSHGHLSKLQGTGYKEDSSGKQHNAPTHLPHYCIFRLVELSLAQFDYMQSAEM